MCGRYAQYAPITLFDVMFVTKADLDSEFDLVAEMTAVNPDHNIAPTQDTLVRAVRDDRLALRRLRWGLVPG